jgi:hypothetical protein
MGKILLTAFLFIFFINTNADSQVRGDNPIPNFSFENWGGSPSNPTGWMTSNTPPFQPVTQAGTATHGSSSAKGTVIHFMTAQFPPLLWTEEFPVSERYGSMTGNYQFFPVGADTFQIHVSMKKGSDIIGSGTIQFVTLQNSWKEFYVDIEYSTADTPTSCIITINLQDANYGNNTNFHIDQLEFGDPELFSTAFFVGNSSVPSVEYSDHGSLTEAADDFMVPSGESWEVGGVKVYGTFSHGVGGFEEAIVHIRADDNNKPGAIIKSDTTDALNSFFGQNFFIPVIPPVSLNPGRYWVNMYAKMERAPDSSVYAWATSTANYGAPFHWRDPHFVFFNVTNWTPGNQVVIGGGQHDLMFKLTGAIDTSVNIQPIGTEIPGAYSLKQNYPNPFNPSTSIEFSIPQKEFISLKVYNILGEEVQNLVNQDLSPGSYRFDFNASSLTSGVYFYRISAGSFTEVKKMLLIK